MAVYKSDTVPDSFATTIAEFSEVKKMQQCTVKIITKIFVHAVIIGITITLKVPHDYKYPKQSVARKYALFE